MFRAACTPDSRLLLSVVRYDVYCAAIAAVALRVQCVSLPEEGCGKPRQSLDDLYTLPVTGDLAESSAI